MPMVSVCKPELHLTDNLHKHYFLCHTLLATARNKRNEFFFKCEIQTLIFSFGSFSSEITQREKTLTGCNKRKSDCLFVLRMMDTGVSWSSNNATTEIHYTQLQLCMHP